MTRQQFLEEIRQLSIEDRIALIEVISRSLREDLETSGRGVSTFDLEILEADESEREGRLAAVRRLRGILKTEGTPPSDEDLKQDYIYYLTKKYS